MALSARARIGPYEIIALLGAGGMGEVYKARDTRLDRTVAIKILPQAVAADPQFLERFDREARVLSQLTHPHICTLYDIGEQRGTAFLVMEYLEGETLADRLTKGPLPLDHALKIAIQIADAVSTAHRHGIVHRDLKPGNVMLTKAGPKLLDFGLAKASQPTVAGVLSMLPTTPPNLTAHGTIMGTFQYMAPEQLEGQEVDARTDIFAFGAVLYEMSTGKKAFEGQNQASLIGAILKDDPPAMSTVRPLIPAAIDHIVRQCLAKDPDERWQSASDVMRALQWALEPTPVTAASLSATRATTRRGRWTIAAATLVLGAIGGWIASRVDQTTTDNRVIRLQIDPPEGGRFIFGASAGGMALSPDGRTAAYVASANGMNGLWVRPLDAAAARLLAGTEGAFYPFWSPDSKSIAFFTAGKLQRVDLAGGTPQTICEAVVGGSALVTAGRGGAWTDDGRILFGSVSSGLFQVPASGGTPAPLTTLEASHGEAYHRWPQMLPGDRFMYLAQGDKPENTGVYAASLAKPADRVRLLSTDTNALYASGGAQTSYLLWLRGGTLVAQELNPKTLTLARDPHPLADPVAKIGNTGQMDVTTSANGLLVYSASNTSSQFTWFDRAGKLLRVTGEPGEYNTFRLSPDGRRVAVSRDRPGGTDLWVLEVERGVPSRFTDSGTNIYPVWSPDGRTILFTAGTQRNLVRKDSNGANEQRLTQSPNNQYATDWSRDGRTILYYEIAPGTERDLWTLPVMSDEKSTADAKAEPYLRTASSESWARFSSERSPHWVAYQSDESGRDEVYVDAFPKRSGKKRISTGGGSYPQWGAGGHELYYVSPDYKLMSVSLRLTADSIEPSAPRALFALPAADVGWSPYDAAPDGQRFLIRATPEREASQPLTVIINWPSLLKK